ncbi:MAG: adenosine deaminase [Clostridium luticellarii]|jgi:adenosine deaminase|uniref:Adenosine deaminase n=1 Tax=Clostridium luticellarii TaxID=1691940 RepID=A0A2T0BBD1_9CLOT|nr:adenosine deaminase [Clostridium luticellarii]MCI1995371.1 adenosine deaminase [Clostridium luticellarii]MCI2039367.1 adenosine deaminase [Clostridium luticellarii]PRR81209.1 Adenine deaminase [Clostridium luticellarii]
MNIDEIFKLIPKVDLHCHLDGSLRPKTILDIAQREKIPISDNDLDNFEEKVKVLGNCKSLKEYLNKFTLPIKIMQKEEYIYRVTTELLEDSCKKNIRYIEIRFAPLNHLENGLKPEQVIKTVLSAMDYGRKNLGIMSNLILCILRQEPAEYGIELIKKARKFLDKGVVAIDLAGNESDFPPEIHREAFKLAKEYGFHRTVHAGETGIPENIMKSIKMLYAERIGHGTYAYKDKQITKYLKETKIPLEVCITSNINTSAVSSYKEHPIKRYLDEGIVVTVNTDNTTVSNTDIIQEFKYLVEYQHFNLNDIKKVIKNGIVYSFASKTDKTNLLTEYNSFINNIK